MSHCLVVPLSDPMPKLATWQLSLASTITEEEEEEEASRNRELCYSCPDGTNVIKDTFQCKESCNNFAQACF